MVDLLNYLVMKYPTSLVSVLFGSVIPSLLRLNLVKSLFKSCNNLIIKCIVVKTISVSSTICMQIYKEIYI